MVVALSLCPDEFCADQNISIILNLPPEVRQTVKTLFAVR
jgi:hypothetical protein